MQNLARVEHSVTLLLDDYQALKLSNRQLQEQKSQWLAERQFLLAEIDRILARLDDVPLEEL